MKNAIDLIQDNLASQKLTTAQESTLTEQFNKFKPQYRDCEKHGQWQANIHDGEIERWFTECPDCKSERVTEKLMDRAAIPPRFKAKSFENFKIVTESDRHAFQVATDYANKFKEYHEQGRCLMFVGQPGIGKTHLATSIANQIIKNQFSALFTTTSDMIKTIRATWSKSSEKSEQQVLDNLTKVDLLILDEVGVQFGTDAEQVQLFEVINRRYEAIKPTLIISNLPLRSSEGQSLESYLGERSFDRLKENGGKVVQFVGKSKRS